MSRLAYFTRETLISLRRNLLMTFAGVMTVAVSLFLFGGILLVSRTVDHGTNKWKHGVRARDLHAGEGEPEPDRRGRRRSSKTNPNVKSYRVPRPRRRVRRVQEAVRRPAGARRERDAGRACPRRSGSCRSSRSSRPRSATSSRTCPASTQINTPAKEVKTLLNVTKWIRWAFFVPGRRCCSRRRCS